MKGRKKRHGKDVETLRNMVLAVRETNRLKRANKHASENIGLTLNQCEDTQKVVNTNQFIPTLTESPEDIIIVTDSDVKKSESENEGSDNVNNDNTESNIIAETTTVSDKAEGTDLNNNEETKDMKLDLDEKSLNVQKKKKRKEANKDENEEFQCYEQCILESNDAEDSLNNADGMSKFLQSDVKHKTLEQRKRNKKKKRKHRDTDKTRVEEEKEDNATVKDKTLGVSSSGFDKRIINAEWDKREKGKKKKRKHRGTDNISQSYLEGECRENVTGKSSYVEKDTRTDMKKNIKGSSVSDMDIGIENDTQEKKSRLKGKKRKHDDTKSELEDIARETGDKLDELRKEHDEYQFDKTNENANMQNNNLQDSDIEVIVVKDDKLKKSKKKKKKKKKQKETAKTDKNQKHGEASKNVKAKEGKPPSTEKSEYRENDAKLGTTDINIDTDLGTTDINIDTDLNNSESELDKERVYTPLHSLDYCSSLNEEEIVTEKTIPVGDRSHEQSDQFAFTLLDTEWDEIKPELKYYGSKKIKRRRLGKEWTDLLAKKIKLSHPGCVLAFRSHRVKSSKSRKMNAPFVVAKAVCKGEFCRGISDVNIPNEEGEKTVHCTVKGPIRHTDSEVNRRNVSGKTRKLIAEKTKVSTPAVVFNENMLNASAAEMELGNFSAVPNPDVLRKMVSELFQREQLHTNIMHELQILKENDELLGTPYIREIGLDPFTILMFSDEQLKTIQTLSASKSLNIYMDATGSLVRNIERQKRPFLYSMVVKLPEAEVPVSVADLVSTQHSIPRIAHFLNTVKRCISLKGHILKVNKVETDFSFALIQASMQVLNNMTLKTYLLKCCEVLQKKEELNMTIHHLCASHMIQDFIRALKRKVSQNINKSTRTLVLQCFAALQNSASLHQGTIIFQQLCMICLSKKQSDKVKAAEMYLQKLIKNFEEPEESETHQSVETLEYEAERDFTRVSIKEASPFTKTFQTAKLKIQGDIQDDCDSMDNAHFFPQIPDLLISAYLPLFPLWSGIMLATIKSEETMTRDTNSPVENWFKYLKTNITNSERDRRPSIFVMKNKAATQARLRLESFPGAKKKKTSRKRKHDDTDLNVQEEVWKKGKKRKGNLYHKSPGKEIKKERKDFEMEEKHLPRVMEWGGQVEDMNLTNTCTIDNGLTMINLFYQKHKRFRELISLENSEIMNTIHTVMTLMNEGNFDQAKLVWARLTTSHSTNLFGDEYEFMMSHLDKLWRSKTVSKCRDPNCYELMRETKESCGLRIGDYDDIDNVQQIVDKWMLTEVDCHAVMSETDESGDAESCTSKREEKRIILSRSPILVVRVYEMCMYNRLSYDNLMQSTKICLDGSIYLL